MKRMIALLLALCLCVFLFACKSSEAEKADELILAIGEVSLDSGSAIEAAQNYYASLDEDQKAEVEHYAELEQAAAAYASLINYRVMMDRYELTEYQGNKNTTRYSDYIVDDAGRILEKKMLLGESGSVEITYEYDDADRVIKETQGEMLFTTTYEYDADGMLVCETSSGLVMDGTRIKQYSYTKDAFDRVTEKRMTDTNGGNYTYLYQYTYDNGGNVSVMEESIEGSTYAFETEYVYNVFGKTCIEYVSDNTGANSWTCYSYYDSVSTYTISPETNAELNTKDHWTFFENAQILPMPESVVNTFTLSDTEKGGAYTLYRYIVAPTGDCGKYLNIIAQECGVEVKYLDESMTMGQILYNGEEIAVFSLQNESDIGLVFAFGISNQ